MKLKQTIIKPPKDSSFPTTLVRLGSLLSKGAFLMVNYGT